MGFFKKKQNPEQRAEPITLQQLLSDADTSELLTIDKALAIPTVTACTSIISNIIASLDVKLYQEKEGKTEEKKDVRTYILNKDTGDTLSPNDFKRAAITEYLLSGEAYAYIKKGMGLFYVKKENVTKTTNADPIFKDYNLMVNGKTYYPFEFFKMLRNTKDGIHGTGIIAENNVPLNVAYSTMLYEKGILSSGGGKKGFLKSENRLTNDAITALKDAWKKLYGNTNENVVVLNSGLDFQEATSTSVEMQLNENKKSNTEEICKMFLFPSGLLTGNITTDEFNNFIKVCINPLIEVFEGALDAALLTEQEKIENYYFQFDTNNLLKGNMLQRYQAYEVACQSGWITKNEIRNKENFVEIPGLDIVTMSLGDVIFNTKENKYFTPNMDTTNDLNKGQSKVGDTVEN